MLDPPLYAGSNDSNLGLSLLDATTIGQKSPAPPALIFPAVFPGDFQGFLIFFIFFLWLLSELFASDEYREDVPEDPAPPSLIVAPLPTPSVTCRQLAAVREWRDKGPLFGLGHDLCSLEFLRISAIPAFIRLALIRQMKIT